MSNSNCKPGMPRRRLLALACALACSGVGAATIDPQLASSAARDGSVDTLIVFPATPRSAAPWAKDADYRVRRRAIVAALQDGAESTQRDVRDWLAARGIAYRPYWIANVIQARLDATQIEALAARGDVVAVRANPVLAARLPQPELQPMAADQTQAVAWGVGVIKAPAVWAAGVTGQGVVVAGQDTGYQWDHPALKAKYRGWNGTSANHNYNWHDAIHVPNGSCNADSAAPCDDHGHGTHTAGTMVGDAGTSHQIGVAPGARWIGCRNMNAGYGTPATYIECMQWFLAPTDLAGHNPNPDRAPDIINNSWGCTVSEGCASGQEIRQAVETLVDAGIFFAVAAGNDGSSCQTIGNAPATFAASFTVGGTNMFSEMYAGSSRGPVPGVAQVKPDVTGPAEQVTSSYPGGGYTSMTGTSMAAPHIAGAAALLMSTNPALKGHPDRVAAILRATAVPLTTTNQACGGIPATTFPNPVQGYGQIDAWAAFRVAEKIFAGGFD